MDTSTDGKDFKYELAHPRSRNHPTPFTHIISWDDIQTLKPGLRIDSKVIDFYTRHTLDTYIKDVGEEMCPPIFTTYESTHRNTLSMDASFYKKDDIKIVMMHNRPEHDDDLLTEFHTSNTPPHFIVVVIFPKKDNHTIFIVIDPEADEVGTDDIEYYCLMKLQASNLLPKDESVGTFDQKKLNFITKRNNNWVKKKKLTAYNDNGSPMVDKDGYKMVKSDDNCGPISCYNLD